MKIGIHVPDNNYVAANATFGGHLKVGRVFPSGMPIDVTAVTPVQFVAKVDAACAPVVAAGMIPFFSYKFAGEPSVVLSGGADAHLLALANWMAGSPDQQYYGSWHHEDEQTSISDTDFAAASDHTYQKTKVANYRSGPIYQGFPYATRPFNPARIPAHYDFLAGDFYITDNEGKFKHLSSMPEWQTFVANVPPTATLFVTERGITDGSGSSPSWDPILQSQTLQADFDDLDALSNPVEGYLYWNQHADAPKLAQYTLNAPSQVLYSEKALLEDVPPAQPPAPPEWVVLEADGASTVDYTTDLHLVKCGVCAALLENEEDAALHYAALHPFP